MSASQTPEGTPQRWRYIALASDTHIVEPGRQLGSNDTIGYAKELVRAIREDKAAPKLLVHLGDVADSAISPDRVATRAAYGAARDVFNELAMPFMALPGNHDDSDLLAAELTHSWDSVTNGIFRRACGGLEIIGVDIKEDRDRPWNGYCPSETLAELDRVLADVSKAIIISHYPLVDVDSVVINAKLSTLNRAEVWELLLRHKEKIEHLFHGHVHVDLSTVFHGLPSRGVPACAENFSLEDHDGDEVVRSRESRGYLLVGIPEQTTASSSPTQGLVVRKRSLLT